MKRNGLSGWPRGRAVRAAAAAAATALFVWALVLAPGSPYGSSPESGLSHYTDAGEILLHGLESSEGEVSSNMPLSSVGAALLYNRGDFRGRRARRVVPAALTVLLLLALGALVLPFEFAFSAAVLFLGALAYRGAGYPWTYPQSWFTVLVVLSACLLARRSREPSAGASLALGLALGASLSFRSTLAFFPPILAVWMLRRERARWPEVLLACGVPYLFTLPTAWMNWSLHHELLLFEVGPADNNIVSGAMGIVPTVTHDMRAFLEGGSPTEAGSAVAWAAGEILRHPVRYALSCVERFLYVLSFRPVLFPLAAYGAWLLRRRSEIRSLTLFVAYFLGVHCLMSVREEYFRPLWPLLAAPAGWGLYLLVRRMSAGGFRWRRGIGAAAFLAAGAAASWISVGGRLAVFWPWAGALAAALVSRAGCPEGAYRPGVRASRVSLAGAGAVLAAALGLSLTAGFYAAAYAGRLEKGARRGDVLEAAAEASPRSAWLLARRGEERLRRGRAREAALDLERAVALRPDDLDWRLDLAWARMLDGKPETLESFRLAELSSGFTSEDRFYLQVKRELGMFAAARRRARPAEARRRLEAAWTTWRDRCAVIDREDTRIEKWARERMSSEGAEFFVEDAEERWGHLLTAEDRAALVAGMVRLVPGDAGLLLRSAETSLKAGRRAEAAAVLGRADLDRMGGAERARAAGLFAELGDPERASVILGGLIESAPGDPELWIGRARLALGTGDEAGCREALRRAASLGPDPEGLRRIAEIYGELGEHVRAGILIDRLLKRSPDDIELLLAKAAESLAAADEAGVRGTLERAEALARDPDDLLRAGELRAELGEHDRALKTFEKLLEGKPRDPALWIAHARSSLAAGDRKTAESSLARARSGSPPARSLRRMAKLYLELGSPDKARELLDWLVRSAPDDAGLWVLRARAAAGTGDSGAAVSALSRAGELDPGPSELRAMAELYADLGRGDLSEAALAKVGDSGAQDAELWIARAKAALTAGRRERARDALDRAEALEPGSAARRRMAGLLSELGDHAAALRLIDGLTREIPGDAGLWIARAAGSHTLGDRAAARDCLSRAEGLSPGPEDLRLMARLYRELGEHGRADRALERISSRPGDAELLVERAESAARNGRTDAARRALAEAEKLDPRRDTRRWMAKLYSRLGDHARAAAVLRKLEGALGRDPGFLIEYARALGKSGDRAAGEKALSRARGLRPSPVQARSAALLYQEWGLHGPAIELLTPLVRDKALGAQALGDRGLCEFLRGKPGQAVKDLEAAIERDSGLLSAYLTLGAVYASMGRPSDERRAYERGAAVPPREGELSNHRLLLDNLEKSRKTSP